MTRMMQTRTTGVMAVIVAVLLLAATTLASPPSRVFAEGECASTIDLMLVLDGSESISSTDFDLMRTFASSLVGHFTIGPTDAHAGIVQFAGEGEGRVEIGLSGDPDAIQTAISAMIQIVGTTDIQEGIALAREQLTTGGRPGAPQVIIVLTDGEHNQPGDPIAEAELARSLGLEVFAIGVGPGPDITELNAIASDPDGEHVFSVGAFYALATILDPLVQVVCPPKPTATLPAEETPPADATPQADATPSPTEASGSGPAAPGDPVLGVVQLPETGGDGAPVDVAQRAGWLTVQALGSLGGVFFLLGATYWVARWRERR